MRFKVSTKPLIEGLKLGVVNANISNFYTRSTIAQIKADKSTLTVNLEAESILSEIRFKGIGDSDEPAMIFVDCALLKQLVSTFETAVTEFEFTENGLVLHAGKSRFTLPQLIDEDVDMTLKSPTVPDYTGNEIELNKDDWKFIKDHQMFAIAMSFLYPIYRNVWVGESGNVLVGDFDTSMFTSSNKSKLGKTCLLSDTIINLFNNLPEGAKLVPNNKNYVVKVETDGFDFLSEFTPMYEDVDDTGNYMSEIILGLMEFDESTGVKVSAGAINKALNQAALLSSNSEDKITLSVFNDHITLADENIDCNIPVAVVSNIESYEIEFKTVSLKSVMSNVPDDDLIIAPMYTSDDSGEGQSLTGIVVKSADLTAVLSGAD